jgi:hypothetical protein
MTARSQEESSAAFDLARKLRDSGFRSFMMRNGYVSGTTVVVAYDDEPVIEVFSRIVSESKPPVIVAVRRPSTQPHGFVFMTIDQVEYNAAAEALADESSIGETASIGMLYDTMLAQSRPKTHLTVPHDWQPTTFRVELAGSSC